MTLENIEELLLIISYKEENEKDARDAFVKLYQTYSPFLSTVLKRLLKESNIYDEELYNALMNNVFLKIYDNPMIFSVPKGAKDDRLFKGWLSKVAKNELFSQLKLYKENNEKLVLTSDIESYESEPIENSLYQSTNHKLLKDALDTLSKRDRDILMTYYMFYEKGSKIPSSVLDELANRHGTSRDNMRQIKHRSEKKIITYLETHSELKSIKNER